MRGLYDEDSNCERSVDAHCLNFEQYLLTLDPESKVMTVGIAYRMFSAVLAHGRLAELEHERLERKVLFDAFESKAECSYYGVRFRLAALFQK